MNKLEQIKNIVDRELDETIDNPVALIKFILQQKQEILHIISGNEKVFNLKEWCVDNGFEIARGYGDHVYQKKGYQISFGKDYKTFTMNIGGLSISNAPIPSRENWFFLMQTNLTLNSLVRKKIIVNGNEIDWDEPYVQYGHLAGTLGDSKITYTKGINGAKGKLEKNSSVNVADGMEFKVTQSF